MGLADSSTRAAVQAHDQALGLRAELNTFLDKLLGPRPSAGESTPQATDVSGLIPDLGDRFLSLEQVLARTREELSEAAGLIFPPELK